MKLPDGYVLLLVEGYHYEGCEVRGVFSDTRSALSSPLMAPHNEYGVDRSLELWKLDEPGEGYRVYEAPCSSRGVLSLTEFNKLVRKVKKELDTQARKL